MINVYITEEEVELAYERTYEHMAEVNCGHDEINRAAWFELQQLAIDAVRENNIYNGRIIYPDNTVYNVTERWVNFY